MFGRINVLAITNPRIFIEKHKKSPILYIKYTKHNFLNFQHLTNFLQIVFSTKMLILSYLKLLRHKGFFSN